MRGPCVKNEGLVFHGMARAFWLLNGFSCWQRRRYSKHLPRICRQLPEKLFFIKLVQNHFPKVFCWFSNFPKIVRKVTENFLKNNRSRVLSKAFSRVSQLSEVFREFWDNFGQRVFSVLFSSWIHWAGWRNPARWSVNQIARKLGRMNGHVIKQHTCNNNKVPQFLCLQVLV